MATIIHADRALNQSSILEFGKNLTDDTMITMYIEQTGFAEAKPFNKMKEFFTNDEFAKYVPDDDCVIQFVPETDNDVLQIRGADYNWWRAPFRKKPFGRMEQHHLFDKEPYVKEQNKQTSDKNEQHKCNVACKLPDGSIEFYESLTGTKKQLISFINTKYAEIQLKTQFEAEPVFAFDPNDDNQDAISYATFDELVEQGKFVEAK